LNGSCSARRGTSWGKSVNEKGEVEESAGEVAEPSELARLIDANKSAWAALREASEEEEGNRGEPSAVWSAATKAEEDTLLAICSYRCRTLNERAHTQHRMLPSVIGRPGGEGMTK